jgi:hypothetical protein
MTQLYVYFIIIMLMDTSFGLKGHCKGKAIPLQAWTGREDSRRARLPNFKT